MNANPCALTILQNHSADIHLISQSTLVRQGLARVVPWRAVNLLRKAPYPPS